MITVIPCSADFTLGCDKCVLIWMYTAKMNRFVAVAVVLLSVCLILHNISTCYEVHNVTQTYIRNEKWPLFSDEKMHSPTTGKTKHIYFLKTHKCGSTSVYKLFLRFGFMNDLTFVLPAEKHSSTICDVPIEENKGYYLPAPKGKHFDILCHHSVYNRSTIQRILPKDTVYIAIVREPFARFVSAILFFRKDYKEKYLTSIKSDNVISTFLANPRKYEPKGMARSFTNNRMAYDFGLAPEDIKNKNKEKISKFIEKIDEEFDLVMVLEYFDESFILMKRMLNWSLNDILYLGISNAGITNKTAAIQNVTEVDVTRHRAWESIDYILYEHFLTKLKRIIANQDDTFEKELEDFRRARLEVTKYCHGGKLAKDLVIKTFHLKQELRVRPYDCAILKKGAFAYFKMLKQTKEGSKKSKTGSNRKRIIPKMLTNYQIQRKISRRKINIMRVK